MLIHWPGTQKLKRENPINSSNRLGTYRALERAHKEGLIKAIGVSNFNIDHLEHLLTNVEIVPAVNQVELHPLYQQKDLVTFCKEKGIVVQSYSTLGEGKFVNGSIKLESVEEISKRTKATPAQVLLRWAVEKGYPVIPKTSNINRLEENFSIFGFEMTEKVGLSRIFITPANSESQDVHHVDAEVEVHGEQKFCWDPEGII
jgi:diketogulonate reductase-like aldo/keto reductase